MRAFYGLTEGAYEHLLDEVTMDELVEYTTVFSPTLSPVSKVSLMKYIDTFGDFSDVKTAMDKIAMAVFKCLKAEDQIEILQYTEMETWL